MYILETFCTGSRLADFQTSILKYSKTSIARGRGDHFNKFESPVERIKFALQVIRTC